jgi:uncharacterized repeat protein (TIGR03809 family)
MPSHIVDSVALGLRPFSFHTGWFMTHRNDAARDAEVIGRWRRLAEQRLDYLTQLFESGRWRRFYGEVAFLDNIREAKVAVETWRDLSAGRSAAAETVIRVTWPVPERGQRPRTVEPPLATAPEAIGIPAIAESKVPASNLTASDLPRAEAPVIDMLALERALGTTEKVLDQGTIEQRYPLLRNTF